MLKIELLTSLDFSGSFHPAGEKMELEKVKALQLIRNGSATEVVEPKKKKKKKNVNPAD